MDGCSGFLESVCVSVCNYMFSSFFFVVFALETGYS
jgi:hypothetical protein